jgi:biotin operon repressor
MLGCVSETTGRVLQLLGLLQSRRVWTGEELAQRLSVTTRCVRRDVERLREPGYPVGAGKGHGGGYRLGARAALPPLLLDPDEGPPVCSPLEATIPRRWCCISRWWVQSSRCSIRRRSGPLPVLWAIGFCVPAGPRKVRACRWFRHAGDFGRVD